MSLFEHCQKIIVSLENSRAPFFYFILTFLTAILVRLFLEFFTSPFSFRALSLWHLAVFYLALALAVAFCLRLAIEQATPKILKIIFCFFFFICLAPLIDLLVSRGAGARMTYLLPQAQPNLYWQFLTFGLENTGLGLTWGIRLEVFAGLLGIFALVYMKGRSWLRSLLTALAVYCFIFFFAITPFILQELAKLLHLPALFSDFTAAAYCWLWALVLASALFIVSQPKQAAVLIFNSRWLRVLVFLFLAGLGFWLGLGQQHFFWNLQTFFGLLLAAVSLLASLAFAYLVNDLQDTASDRLAASQVLLDNVPKQICWMLAGSSALIAIVSASQISVAVFFLVALMLGLAWVYSLPPWRLKRVLIISKIVISLEALLVLMLGFVMAGGSLANFPKSLVWLFLAAVSLAANFLYLKDYQADKQAGLVTLPVVLGFNQAKVLIGFFMFLAYGAAYWLLRSFLLRPEVLLGLGFLVFLLFLKKYREKHILIVFLLSLLFVLISWQK